MSILFGLAICITFIQIAAILGLIVGSFEIGEYGYGYTGIIISFMSILTFICLLILRNSV